MNETRKGLMVPNMFSPGDLVLAKLEKYPLWPAIVQKCSWKDEQYRGKWKLKGKDDGPSMIWCFFLGDQAAYWVSVDDVKRFTPAEARRIQCMRGSVDYGAQKAVLEEAEKLYSEQLLGASSYSGISEEESSSHDTEGECCTPGSSTDFEHNIKRPYTGTDVTDERKKKSLKWKLGQTGSDTVASLRRAIQKKDKELERALSVKRGLERSISDSDAYFNEFENINAFAEIPDFPLHIDCELPEDSAYQSKPITGDRLEDLFEDLKISFFNFKYKLKKCTLLRDALKRAIAEQKAGLDSVCSDIKQYEHLAREEHAAVTNVLERLLAISVELSDLRQRRAGKLVTQILKSCNESSCIRFLCTRIIDQWKEQCRKIDEKPAEQDKE